ncbi:beta strand repeat-containing protein [Aurantiacibacter sp. MUD61]|uniref:beta strand repeat-containing protein n=1 Tax=Aurantiacibacter sp. MUD61 TaxID=3009083 RepID=UPI0022F13D61|nr:hypothetical protein [Aurantiacibacter sp. MUD61]
MTNIMTKPSMIRSRLLHSCAGAAMLAGLAFGATEASAQGIQATPAVVQGSAQIDESVMGTTRITVDTLDTVIDWRADFDPSLLTTETFLPAGNTAIFQNGANNFNFAVLNRIIPGPDNAPALFEGLVQSFLTDPFGVTTPGGFVAFYSPTGIIVGPTGRFEVPQLMLTTQAVDITTISGFANGTGSLFMSGASGAIDIQAGAVLTGAPGTGGPEDSFLIVASPQISMAGSAFYNGSIAYVASEAVFLNHSSGLFDIIITQGVTAGGQTITHTGSSGGPSSTGAGDEHVIYGVTQASAFSGGPVSMLFSGNLGFQPAASATIVNGDVILSANYNVSGRTVDGDDSRQGADSFFDGRSQVPGERGDILLSGIVATSNLLAISTHQTNLDATTATSTFAGDLSLVGREQAVIDVGSGPQVLVDGDLFVSARNFGLNTQATGQEDATGGLASIRVASDALLTVLGETMVAASAVPGLDFIFNNIGSGTGGQAQILSEGGTIDLRGNVRMESYARTDQTFGTFDGNGAMQGGQVQFLATQGGSLSTLGTLSVDASATAPELVSSVAPVAGDATGGGISIGTGVGGGSVSIAGDVTLDASALITSSTIGLGVDRSAFGGTIDVQSIDFSAVDIGGSLTGDASAQTSTTAGGAAAGNATGGSASITVTDGDMTVATGITMDLLGNAGAGESGGDAVGGSAGLSVTNGSLDAGGSLSISTNAVAGSSSGSGDGGNALGGGANILLDGGDLINTGATSLSANAQAGSGANSGDAAGGSTTINLLNGGSWSASTISSDAIGLGANATGGAGGDVIGGETSLLIGTGSTLTLANSLTMAATANGSVSTANGGDGSSASGGSAAITIDGGTLDGPSAGVSLIAPAQGGNVAGAGFTAGSASGGSATLDIVNGGSASLTSLLANSNALAGDGGASAVGGNASGGFSGIAVADAPSSLTLTGQLSLQSLGVGGLTNGGSGIGGIGDGGDVGLAILRGGVVDLTGAAAQLVSAGSGGDSSVTGGEGGSASSGLIDIDIANGTLTGTSITLTGIANGGNAVGANTVDGGAAETGEILITALTGSTLDIAIDAVSTATGGSTATGTGGNASGGAVTLQAGFSDIDLGTNTLLASEAVGGDGVDGGSATSGDALLSNGDSTLSGGNVTVRSSALGGTGTAANGDATSALARFFSLGSTSQVDLVVLSLISNAEAGAGAIANSGSAEFDNDLGPITIGDILLDTDALGVGTGTPGLALFRNTGSVTADTLTISALGSDPGPQAQILADGGALNVLDTLSADVTGDILLQYLTGGTIIGGPDSANLTATFDVTAGGTITLDGDDGAARNIAALNTLLTSHDIEVGADTLFGGDAVALTSTNVDAQAVLGGTSAGSGYSLLADEAAAIDATSLSIFLPNVGGTDVDAVIDDLTLLGSGDQRFASIDLFVDGSLDIFGAFNYTSTGSGDTLSIGAEGTLFLTLPTGSIRLDSGSALAGTLQISATDFIAADADLIADILADPASAAVVEALLDDGGAAEASSYISADRVEINALGLVYGQNTGANGIYGGIEVGPGGLLITQASAFPGQLRVIAFGTQDDGTGQLTNNDFFFVVEFATDRVGTYTPDATFNNCIIVTSTCPEDPVEEEIEVPVPNQILIEQPLAPKFVIDEGTAFDFGFGFDFPGLMDAPLISEDELVREPVTSGSDSALHALSGSADDDEGDE